MRIPTIASGVASLVIILSFAASPGRSLGADDARNAGRESGKLSIPEEEFVRKAVQGGITEVKLGELAGQKGQRDDVKKFGARMVTDHTNANDDLQHLALGKGVTLAGKLDAIHEGAVDRLATLEGSQFDKAYIDDMVKDHVEDVAEFEKIAGTATDPDLRAFLTKTLPVLRSHLQEIKALQNAPGK
jgi:putative membrane protein